MRITAPAVRITAPAVRITAPAVRITAPAVRMTAPVVRITAAAVRMTAPAVLTTAPVVRMTAPVVRITAPARAHHGPRRAHDGPRLAHDGPRRAHHGPRRAHHGPAVRTTAPAVRTTAPAVRTTAPAVRTTAPVVRTTAPGVRTTAPPLRTTAPPGRTTAPPVLTTAAAVRMTAPVVLTTAPAVRITAPVSRTTALLLCMRAPAAHAPAWPRHLVRRAAPWFGSPRPRRQESIFTIFDLALENALRLAIGGSGTHGGRAPTAARRARPSRSSVGVNLSQGKNIMGTSETASHPRASLGVTRTKAPGVISRATIMYAAFLAAIATFSAAPITMAAFLLMIQAMQAAQTASASRGKGLAAVRNTKITPLWNAMILLRVYVQGLVDQVDPASGLALINQAGLVVGGVAAHVKILFVATLDPTANVVHLVLNAKAFLGSTSKRVTFHWQISSDGKTWTSLPSTPYAQTQLPSPGPGSYAFRAAATVGKTVVDWTTPFPLTIH